MKRELMIRRAAWLERQAEQSECPVTRDLVLSWARDLRRFAPKAGDIGEDQEEWDVEPLEVPQHIPQHVPVEAPREPVPA